MTQFVPARDNRGNPVARCTCNDCGAEKVVRCNQLETSRGKSEISINEGQAIAKLTADGWTYIKKVIRCPKCEAARKETTVSKEPATVITIPPPPAPSLRRPTRDQKRLIVAALEEAYDTKNQRYKGLETDKGIADMLADGIMSGWVAAVREDMFGPDGNEEMGDLAEKLAAWMKKIEDGMALIADTLAELEKSRAEVKKYQDRLNKIVIAIGPKAEKLV